jgi:hypothetical protein
MKSYRDRVCLVYDHGLFVELAVTLSRDFGRVLYYSPWETCAPKSNARCIGEGVEGIERVASIWPHIDAIDLFVFPDVYEGALQEYLANQGKRVWGCRMGEELELDRVAAKEHCRDLGIDIGKYAVHHGIDALRAHLKTHKNQFVKIPSLRGDMETFKADSYELIEPRLNELAGNVASKTWEFITEDEIPDAIEVGYDGYTIDGRFPKEGIVGVEVKDEAYACTTMSYRDLPQSVRGVNQCLSGTLQDYRYRGFISTEIRATDDGKAYLIDPCCRCGSPPSELYQMMIGNIADVMWHGAEGVVIEPEFIKPFGAQLLLISDWADKNWQQVEFPKSIRDHVKLHNLTVIDGEYYVAPQWTGNPAVGAVVAMGDTLEEAIDECKRLSEMVEGYSIDKPVQALDKAAEQLTEFLGEQAPKSRQERKAESLAKSGRISPKAMDKMREKARA